MKFIVFLPSKKGVESDYERSVDIFEQWLHNVLKRAGKVHYSCIYPIQKAVKLLTHCFFARKMDVMDVNIRNDVRFRTMKWNRTACKCAFQWQ